MHATLEKFGYPDNCLIETQNWCLLLRPTQVTLGSLVLGHKNADIISVADIPPLHFVEFSEICKATEEALRIELLAKKFNYLALMMVDPQVHFHVLPRYEQTVLFMGQKFSDKCWPGPPDISTKMSVSAEIFGELSQRLMTKISDCMHSPPHTRTNFSTDADLGRKNL